MLEYMAGLEDTDVTSVPQTVRLSLLFSPLGTLAERAIYFANDFFFIFYFFYFLVVIFPEPVAQRLMDRSSLKFQDW